MKKKPIHKCFSFKNSLATISISRDGGWWDKDSQTFHFLSCCKIKSEGNKAYRLIIGPILMMVGW